MDTQAHIVAEVLEYGQDENGLWRRVRFVDGSERVQRAHVEVEGTITRADGTVEPGGEIIDINVTGASICA